MRRAAASAVGLVVALCSTLPATAAPREISNAGPKQLIDDPTLRADVDTLLTQQHTNGASLVQIEVLTEGERHESLVRVIAELDGTVTGSLGDVVLQASIPVGQLERLIAAEPTAYVRSPRSMSQRPVRHSYTSAGPRTTEAVSVMNVDDWQAGGHRGAGVRVGIIDYFNQSMWSTQQAVGEVPSPAGTFCREVGSDCSIWNPDEDGHGNAVAEIIHDLAPSASLYLATVETVSDYAAVIDWFAANGVTIINRSLGTPYDGPGDGTGPMDSIVDFAASKGMTWFNSAGNEGYNQYWRGSWSDTNNNGWLEFAPGDETLDISSTCFSLLGARWNDWGPPATRTDYDFYIYENGVQVYPDEGPSQQSGAPPIELDGVGGCGRGGAKSIRVRKYSNGSGTNGDVLEVLSYQGLLQHTSSSYAASTSVVDSSNRALVAVGAVDSGNGAGPGSVAYYSSNGPTNDGRRKPDLAAPTCLTSSVFAPDCFDGTSAASPAAAGTAAIVQGAGQSASAEGLAAILKHWVVDGGPPGPDNQTGTGEVRLPAPSSGAVDSRPTVFQSITPRRILDTRQTNAIASGRQDPETIIDLPVAGAGVVPSGASAVAVNLTVVDAVAAGYAQAFPTRWGVVDAVSTVNIETPRQTLPNFAIVPIGSGGAISIYAPSGGHVLIDVLGYFAPSNAAAAGRLVSLNPQRVLDTRQSTATLPQLLPSGWVDHKPQASEVVTFDVAALGGPANVEAAALVLTVTGTSASADGYVTAYPSGVAPPDASVLNLVTGSTAANTIIVPRGSDGRVSLFTSAGTHLIVDVQGYITNPSVPSSTGGRFVPVTPRRPFDSRSGPAVETRNLLLADGVTVPSTGVDAVSINATAAPGLAVNGFLQMWPSGGSLVGEFSNLNWTRAGQIVSSGSIVRLGSDGTLNVRAEGSAHLLIDINGYFTSSVSAS